MTTRARVGNSIRIGYARVSTRVPEHQASKVPGVTKR
jgi:hypothetical protein